MILFCKNVPCTTNFFISIVLNHPFTENMISQESIMDSFVVPLFASLFQIMGLMIFFVFWKFPISVAMRSSLLDYVFWNRKKVHRIYNETSIGHCSFKRCPHVQKTMPTLQYDRHALHCVLGQSRTIQTALRCPLPESSVLTPH